MSVERCPKCGTPYQDDAAFCINCGMSKEEAAKAEEPGESGFAPPNEEGDEASVDEAASDEPDAADAEEPDTKRELAVEPKPEPKPEPEPASEPEESDEAAARLEGEMKPVDEVEFEPSKKGRGCCFAIVIGGIIGFVSIALGVAVLVIFGVIGGGGAAGRGGGDTYDFAEMKDADFEVWSKGEGAVVANENGMLVLKDALLGLEKDYGSDYSVEVTVFFKSVGENSAWAGPVLRVNPGGGDRYAFKLMPETDRVAVERDGDVFGEKKVGIETGTAYLVYAEADGNDLGLAVNDTPLVKATDIGLIAGGVGLEARGCTAYFDDLTVKVLK
jgi:predicted  nucleic acid-binding Zn-ribbon protein